MKAGDTVMEFFNWEQKPDSMLTKHEKAIAKAQAEISFKAGQEEEKAHWVSEIERQVKEADEGGIKDVVEWLSENCACFQPDPEKNGEYIIPGWQAKLKDWFKDNPELLKEWGID